MKGIALLAATCALTVTLAVPAAASSILFNPLGTGGTSGTAIDVLDPSPGNSISLGLNGGSTATSPGTLLFQANIADATIGGSPAFGFTFGFGTNPGFQVVAGLSETVASNIGGTLTFAFSGTGTNFFDIYEHTGAANQGNNETGACFITDCSGTLIMSGSFIATGFSASFTVAPTCPPSGSPTTALDTFDSDLAGISTVCGNGSFQGEVLVNTVNPFYFPASLDGTTIIFASSEQNLPFGQADPSQFFTSNGTSVQNQSGYGSVGPVNGLGTNTMLQTDANLSFNAPATVPEPATLTLLGLGLAAGSARLRRMRNKKS